MPASTPFLGLYKPGGGSSGLILPDEVVDIDRINGNSDIIDQFAKSYGPATERNHQFYGPAASLGGVIGMKLGDTYQESDGNKVLWRFDGTGWVYAPGQLLHSLAYSAGNITALNTGADALSANTLPANQKVRIVWERLGVFATTAALIELTLRMRNDGSALTYNTGILVSSVRGYCPGSSQVSHAPGLSWETTLAATPQKIAVGVYFIGLSAGAGGIYGSDGITCRVYSS